MSVTTTIATMPAALSPAPPLVGRLYEVGGRQLALHREGECGPSVVFLPGAGLIGLDFLNIHEAVRGFATSVLYDRGGTGWSDPLRLPRSAAAAAGELRELLRAAEVPAPYILVAHSLGGAYARRFSQLFPGEMAGVVYLDPAHEGYAAMPPQSLLAQLKMGLKALPALLDARRFYRPLFSAMYRTWPDGLRETLVEYHLRHWRRSLQEAANLNSEVLPEIAAGGAAPAQPTVVLTSMGVDPFMAPFMPEPTLRDLNARKAAFYSAFAALAPRGENRLLPDAGHSTLHTDRPDAVMQAIRDLIDWSRPIQAR
jgi:pimeloyl-ACP methyl ester carboxylesterase